MTRTATVIADRPETADRSELVDRPKVADRIDPLDVLASAGIQSGPVPARATVTDVSRSHDVAFVALDDGRRFVVKQVSAAAREQGRSLAAELFVYRMAGWQPELARVVPRPVLIDERHELLVLEAAPLAQLYPAQFAKPGFPGPAAAAALGAALGRLHRATTGVPALFPAGAGVLDLPEVAPAQVMPAGGAAAERVAETVAADDVLVKVLRRGRQAWRPSCLIHADVKWDNAIIDPGPPVEVKLFDWELSGSGDPAWDLAGALADLRAVRIRLRGVGAVPGAGQDWVGSAEVALLSGYASAAGHLDEDFADRVVPYWAARTVHLALESATGARSSTHLVVTGLLSAAQRLSTMTDGVAAAVRSGLDRAR